VNIDIQLGIPVTAHGHAALPISVENDERAAEAMHDVFVKLMTQSRAARQGPVRCSTRWPLKFA